MSEPSFKRPASQYYWGDWFKDLALQSCTLPARGLWHEMNCLMHQGQPYGHLTLPNGTPMQAPQLANLCKITVPLCKRLLDELEGNGVFSRDEQRGTIFSRRMVRDEAIRNARANGGKEGAEHGAKGAEHGAKGGRPAKDKGGSETPLPGASEPPPSSSSSGSPTPSVEHPPKPPRKRRGKASDDEVVAHEQLVAEGVGEQHARDWLTVRRDKRLPLTPTAWADVKAEAALAGLSLDEAIRTAVVNSWGGFKAKWLDKPDTKRPLPAASAREQRMRDAVGPVVHLFPTRPQEGDFIDTEARDATPAISG